MKFDLSKYKGITGTIEVGLPTYRQRLRILKDCQVSVNQEGDAVIEADSLDMMIKMIDATIPYYEKVDVKHKDATAKSFDELEQHQCFDQLIADVANFIIRAGQLGE